MQASRTRDRVEANRADRRFVVLLVDDYQDCREMYAACLSLAGLTVLTARDGHEALLLARQTVPDLVLMDIGLPVMDGFETTNRLKADPVTRSIPVIALTAHTVTDVDQIRAAGFQGVITKPCLPDDLAGQVERVVRGEGREPIIA